MSSATLEGPDGGHRCAWCLATPQYRQYHDTEWGFPVADDQRLFEKLCLEGFQSGLSWRTVLEKRENFREAFEGFDIERVAAFTDTDIERLLNNPGIIRHRGKISAAVNNARKALELVEEEGSLADFVWRYEPKPHIATEPANVTTCAESHALSRELKKRGWKFVGPTTLYSFMQAMGLVNDHALGCVVREEVEAARSSFSRPSGR
ncbi:MAG TPA: DNA-3-methyladenine glycosylase I [Burkholderiaceae bacterium]|nr:DNA-3-methyladenine glycosylase I [Burkholderiaceae bacterium]